MTMLEHAGKALLGLASTIAVASAFNGLSVSWVVERAASLLT